MQDRSAPVREPAAAPLAVVVATRDRAHLLAGLLDALALALRPCDEVVVVDSAGRSTATAELCAERGVRVVRVDRPGTSLARNAGWRATSAAFVAFTDDDCLPARDWLRQLSAVVDSCDLVTGRVLPDREVPAPVSLLTDPEPQQLSASAPLGHGANCAVRRTSLEAVGGFDERLGPGTALRASEDVDLFRRVLEAGGRGRYEPSVVVVHRQWRGRGQALRLSFSYGLGQAGAAANRGAPVRTAVWANGLRAAARDARAGYLTGVVAGLLWAAGAVVGAVLGRRRR